VKAGTDGTDYLITCKATASDGSVYELEGLMLVADVPLTAETATTGPGCVVRPILEPVSLAELKLHLRIDHSDEDELLKAFITLNIKTNIVLSGRTDKEVHATGQVFNCQIPSYWTDFKKLKEILNKRLPSSIQIRDIVKTNQDKTSFEMLTEKMIIVFNKGLFENEEDYYKAVAFVKKNLPKQNKNTKTA
jgi:hypothetical protein